MTLNDFDPSTGHHRDCWVNEGLGKCDKDCVKILYSLADSRPVVSEAAIEAAVKAMVQESNQFKPASYDRMARAALTAALPHMGDGKGEAWDEGYASGKSNAMRRMSDEPNAPITANPYRLSPTGDDK